METRAEAGYSNCSCIRAVSPGPGLLSWTRPVQAEHSGLSARTEIEIYLSVLTLSLMSATHQMLWQTLQTSAQGQGFAQTHTCKRTSVRPQLCSCDSSPISENFAAERKSGPAKSELLIRKPWYPVIWVTVHLNEPKNRTQLALEMKPVELHNKCNYTLKYFLLPSKILDTLLVFLDIRGTCKRCGNTIRKIFFCLSH